jgi:hypothetical protein
MGIAKPAFGNLIKITHPCFPDLGKIDNLIAISDRGMRNYLFFVVHAHKKYFSALLYSRTKGCDKFTEQER